jgi:hypothetical protein
MNHAKAAGESAECWDILNADEEAALAVIRDARTQIAIRRIDPTLDALVEILAKAGVVEERSAGPTRVFMLGAARFAMRFDPRDSALIDVSFG